MRYTAKKRRYIDSLLILLVGIVSLSLLGIFVKAPMVKKTSIPKPSISINSATQFIYVANTASQSSVAVFNLDTLKTDTLYTIDKADNISTASLFLNHLLYLHGITNFIVNKDTKKIQEAAGDYISPDGKKFISIENPSVYYGQLVFSVLDESSTKDASIIKTQTPFKNLHKFLGWSVDATHFYYTADYLITKQTSMSATDHWIQKVGKEMKPMSRERIWMQSSTTSAEMIFGVNTQDSTITKFFPTATTGPIHNAFYNNSTNDFYLETASGFFRVRPSDKDNPQSISSKLPSSTNAIVFSSQSDDNRFVHSDGKGIALTNLDTGTDEGIFYATGSAKVIPLALTGNKVIFSLQDNNHYVGEIVDLEKKTRIEFSSYDATTSADLSFQPFLFVSWLKKVSVHF